MERSPAAVARWVEFDEERAWRDSEPETQVSPPLFMDGISHERGNPNARCCRPMERCWWCCVGFIHRQGVYGGYMKECDYCGHGF